jgi:hypothetical protein
MALQPQQDASDVTVWSTRDHSPARSITNQTVARLAKIAEISLSVSSVVGPSGGGFTGTTMVDPGSTS